MKIWLHPQFRPDYSVRLSARQQAEILKITRRIRDELTEAWDDYFSKSNS